ncbi:hypothetical protein [Sphingomonas aracearum]|uniref:hypothetical protein n=1 Tax=Sphingomonas aracearum TaxID=2283317 RepID=UPI0011C07564|nr:hypothetical protein [Sphingomonas aracearum]
MHLLNRQTVVAYAPYPSLAWFGWAVMGDLLGLEGFLKALEKYWGPKWTGRFTTFMGISIALFVIETVTPPLWRLIQPYFPAYWTANAGWAAFIFSMQLLGAIGCGSWLIDGYRQRIMREQIEEHNSIAQETMDRADQLIEELRIDRAQVVISYDEAIAKLREAQDRLSMADLAMETVYSNALSERWLTQSQVDELRSLANTAPKTPL